MGSTILLGKPENAGHAYAKEHPPQFPKLHLDYMEAWSVKSLVVSSKPVSPPEIALDF